MTDVNARLTRMNDEKDQNSNEEEKVYEKLTPTKLEIDDLRLSVNEVAIIVASAGACIVQRQA